MSKFIRRDVLLTKDEISKIENARIALFGLGGVGGYTLEALVRMGIKNFFLCDGDIFDESNLNRQILSLESNIGCEKVLVAKERVLSINNDVKVDICNEFIDSDTINNINFNFDYIIDAIDDTDAKVLLIKKAKELNIPIISMMGAGNRLNATFKVSDIYKTKEDPLSKKMRYLLKNEGINHVKVVYTEDKPIKPSKDGVIGSVSYIVGMAGLTLAQEVINDLIKGE